MPPPPSLSPIWRALPNDLTEVILSHLVASNFSTDPAYTWTSLRHLSAHQKRAIELRFARVWLPTMSITIYGGTSHQVEYRLDDAGDDSGPNPDEEGYATFVVDTYDHQPIGDFTMTAKRLGTLTGKYIQDVVWPQYDEFMHRSVTVRLGEGVLNGGAKGGYLLNDTSLPGLEVVTGERIRLLWKGAVDELLREEMYMRRVGEAMFTTACAEYLASAPQGIQFPSLMTQLRFLRGTIQSVRRTAALRHRIAKAHHRLTATTGLPAPEGPAPLRRGSLGSAWVQPPDIFEVVEIEESVVPLMGAFSQWLERVRREESRKGVAGGVVKGDYGGEEEKGAEEGEVAEVREEGHAGEEHDEDGGGGVSDQAIVELYRAEWAMRCCVLYGEEEAAGMEAAEMELEARSGRGGREVFILDKKHFRWELPYW